MNEPTDSEKKRFWEYFGFVNKDERLIEKGNLHLWLIPDGSEYIYDLPPVDLNNLFRWAVPKLDEHSAPAVEWVLSEFCQAVYQHKDPTLALFWAVRKVIFK